MSIHLLKYTLSTLANTQHNLHVATCAADNSVDSFLQELLKVIFGETFKKFLKESTGKNCIMFICICLSQTTTDIDKKKP
jgi:hypothetical protein